MKTTPVIPSGPEKAADEVFAALMQDWDRMSIPAQGRLIRAVAILCKYHTAEALAVTETQRIIKNMMGRG